MVFLAYNTTEHSYNALNSKNVDLTLGGGEGGGMKPVQISFLADKTGSRL